MPLSASRYFEHYAHQGNCRIRTNDAIVFADGKDITLAKGDNPNPFYQLNKVKEPIISPKAEIGPLEMIETYLYDIATEKGRKYTLILSE